MRSFYLLAALLPAVFGCAITSQQLQFDTALAEARAGEFPAQLELAQRYSQPDHYPEWQGMKPNALKAAKWCLVLQQEQATAYASPCGAILARAPAESRQAASIMADGFLHPQTGTGAGGRGG